MKILYAGDSPIGGPADYLLGILKFIEADFFHLPPQKILKARLLKNSYDAFVLSDFSADRVPPASQKRVVEQVQGGAGLLMVGGWGSFSGPDGKWRGSLVEEILPVTCLNRDDRVSFPGGAWMILNKSHPMFRPLEFKNPPVICGLNHIRPRKNSWVLLSARKILTKKGNRHLRLALDRTEYPLLVVDRDPRRRIAAFATDLAPHWCGGLVDWGKKRLRLRVTGGVSVEVGDLYVRFVASLLTWLARK